MCWYCYWGWPKPIADVYLRAIADLGGRSAPLLYGPAHIVWADCNFDSAQWCIDNFDKYAGGLEPQEREVVMRSLRELLEVPNYLKHEPEGDYSLPDDDAAHPPWPGVVMVQGL